MHAVTAIISTAATTTPPPPLRTTLTQHCLHALTPTAALATCTVLILCNHSKPASEHMHTPYMLSLKLLHSPLALSLSYAITPSQLQNTCTLLPSLWSKLSPPSMRSVQASFIPHAHSFYALTPTAALATCTVLILCNHSKPAFIEPFKRLCIQSKLIAELYSMWTGTVVLVHQYI